MVAGDPAFVMSKVTVLASEIDAGVTVSPVIFPEPLISTRAPSKSDMDDIAGVHSSSSIAVSPDAVATYIGSYESVLSANVNIAAIS